MFDLDAALRHLVEAGGSDLHLKVPSKPLIRLDGELVAIPDSTELNGDTTMGITKNTFGTTPDYIGYGAEKGAFTSYWDTAGNRTGLMNAYVAIHTISGIGQDGDNLTYNGVNFSGDRYHLINAGYVLLANAFLAQMPAS